MAEQVNAGEAVGQAVQADQSSGNGSGQQASAGSQQQQAQEEMLSIPVRQLNQLGVGKDFNKVIHMAKEYQDFDRDGFAQMAQEGRKRGYTGFDLLSVFAKPEEERTGAEQAKVDDATKQIQQQAANQGQPLTKDDVARMIQDGFQSFQQGQSRQQSHAQAQRAETTAYDEALQEAKFETKKEDIDIRGQRVNVDFWAKYAYKPALSVMAQELYEQGLNPSDPQYEQKRWAPIPPEIVREAAAIVLPRFKAMAQQRVAQDLNNATKMPPTTLVEGVGGRGGKDPKTMNREERIAAAFASAEAKGKIKPRQR